jgi:hypothetical protein
MESEACKTLPHAAFKLLAILLLGNVKESNGTLAATDSYCRKYGFVSRETRHRCLIALKERGLIVCTRQGMKMRKIPSLWAVTWWPTFNRNGQPLKPELPPTHAYLHWKPTAVISHTDSRAEVTPIVGVDAPSIHTDLAVTVPEVHTDDRWNSRVWPQADPTAVASSGVDVRIGRLLMLQPHLENVDVARIMSVEIERVARVRAQMIGSNV